MYDQVPTGLWLYDLAWRKKGTLSAALDLKVLIRGVVLNIAWNSSGSVVLYMWSYHSMDENW